MDKKVPLWQIFLVFAKIGAFTIGGGYAMIPIIQDEMSRKKWIPEDELPDIVALSQSAPGVMAVNISIFAGYRLRGIKGSIAATLGSIPHCRPDDQNGEKEQQDLVGMGNLDSRPRPGGLHGNLPHLHSPSGNNHLFINNLV